MANRTFNEHKWDDRFLDVAKLVASWSKDPSSHVGAIAVLDRKVVATGFNGFPKGVHDSESRYNNRDEKLKFIVHAEMNCVYNAAYHGQSLKGATLYVDGIATCSKCALGIISSGVYKVVMRYKTMKTHWAEEFELSKVLFNEAGIEFYCEEIKASESFGSGDEPVEQTDARAIPESFICETRGVGHRHGSISDVIRELYHEPRYAFDGESRMEHAGETRTGVS